MHLRIYSLKKVLFEGEAKSLTAKSTGGELTILDNHLPLITVLQAGLLKITDEKNAVQAVDIASGFLEIKPESIVTVLADL